MRRTVVREGRDGAAEEIQRAVTIHGLRGPDFNGNYSTNCPWCERRGYQEDRAHKLTWKVTGETSPQLGREPVSLSHERGAFNCYRCGRRGFADFTWMLGDDEAPAPPPAPAEVPVDLGPPPGFVPIAECARSLSMRWASAYLERRGVLEQAAAAGAGACASWAYRRRDGTTFEVPEGRVVVPYLSTVDRLQQGPLRWLGYSARLVLPRPGREAAKYLYPPGMDRRRALWGLPTAPHDGRPLYVVEGVFDALPLWPYGVATLGKSLSEDQVTTLAALGRPLVVALDGDAWSEGRALAAQLRLRGVPGVSWARLPPGEDPGSLGWRVRDFVVEEE